MRGDGVHNGVFCSAVRANSEQCADTRCPVAPSFPLQVTDVGQCVCDVADHHRNAVWNLLRGGQCRVASGDAQRRWFALATVPLFRDTILPDAVSVFERILHVGDCARPVLRGAQRHFDCQLQSTTTKTHYLEPRCRLVVCGHLYSVRAVIHEPDVSDPDDTHAINNHHFHNDDDNSSWKEPLTVTDGTTVAPFPSGRLCNLFVDEHFTDLLPRILDLIVLFIVPILVQLVLYVAVATKLWTNQVGLRSNTVSDFLVFRCSRAEPFRMATADNRMQYLRLSSSGHFALSAILLRTFRCFYC